MLLGYQDHVERVPASLDGELGRISDPFRRALLGGALWDSVRERRMNPRAYSEPGMKLLVTENDAELAVSILGRMTIPGVPLKQRDRWNIIAALIASGDASGAELLAAESRRATSDDGRKYA